VSVDRGGDDYDDDDAKGGLKMQDLKNKGPQKQHRKMEDMCNYWVNLHNREVFYSSTVAEHT